MTKTLAQNQNDPIICTKEKISEGGSTYAVGHFALGYLCGKATSKALKVKVNLQLIFLVAIISDIDLLIPGLKHGGPTHSLFMLCLFAFPAFTLYGKKVTPYFIAAISHPLVGDGATGRGVQLLWPTTSSWYGGGIGVASLTNVFAEWTLFLAASAFLIKTRDAGALFQHHPSNLLLSIPTLTVLLPTFFSFPLSVPSELIIPHLIYLTIFMLSILTDIYSMLKGSLARTKY